MKKRLICVLVLLCLLTLGACGHNYQEDFGPAYVTGEVLEIYEDYFLLKIEDYHGCFFYDEEIYVQDENAGKAYAVGDHVQVEYGGIFQDYDPPRVGTNSITKMEADAPNAMVPMVMIDGDMYPNTMYQMVMVGGEIYRDTGFESETNERKDAFDGTIIWQVGQDQKPTVNDQSNFGTGYGYQFGETEGTVELFINERWWIYATEEARDRIFFSERYEVVDSPPDLIVNYGDQSVKARHCLTNWEFTMEDGMISALMGDGLHPLMAKHTSPFVTLDPAEPMEIWLSWDIMPDLVEVNCWGEEAWEELETEPVESYRIMEGNEAGDSYLLRPENGNYIYEIIATWQNAPNFGGTVRYSFHTET